MPVRSRVRFLRRFFRLPAALMWAFSRGKLHSETSSFPFARLSHSSSHQRLPWRFYQLIRRSPYLSLSRHFPSTVGVSWQNDSKIKQEFRTECLCRICDGWDLSAWFVTFLKPNVNLAAAGREFDRVLSASSESNLLKPNGIPKIVLETSRELERI